MYCKTISPPPFGRSHSFARRSIFHTSNKQIERRQSDRKGIGAIEWFVLLMISQ